jgi:NAD(P)-dependent dehydrogenase (short-subunit alcohol dehydrogenase family)
MISETLKDRVAVISGAGSGIGAAIAQCFAGQGATTIGFGRQKPETCFYNYECDVANTEQVDELAKVIHNEVANVDILVHAAAISDNATIFETSAERFGEIYNVNVGGAVRLIQKFAPNMINRKMGSIILLSSINADFATPTLAAYAASKGALNNLTKTAALELAPLGVRVNAIAPASIDTPLLQSSFAAQGDSELARARNIGRHPLGRLGSPEDVASLALFLASDQSSWITGSIYLIDGGAHVTRR